MSQNAQGGVRDSEESFYFLWISAPFSLRDLKPLMFTANLDEMGLFLFKHSVSDKALLRGQVVSYVGGNNKHYDFEAFPVSYQQCAGGGSLANQKTERV